jgi:hypothetical protein
MRAAVTVMMEVAVIVTTVGLGIPIFGPDFWDPHWKRNSNTLSNSGDPLLKSHQIGILIWKFGILIFFLRWNSGHLILYQKTIAISFPTKITSTCSTCKMSRCDVGGTQNK